MSRTRWAWLLILAGTASASELGIPFLRNFSYREYRLNPQNWAAVEDSRGILYFANNDGVLEYDGTTWRTIPVNEGSNVRSVGEGVDGRVYAGCQADFGYLEPDRVGKLQYVSLLDKVPASDRGFKDVWQVIPTQAGVFFRSEQRFFRWSPAGLRSWRPTRRFYRAFLVDGEAYVMDEGDGLKRVHGDELELVPGGRALSDTTVRFVSRWDRGQLLVATPTALLVLGASGVQPLVTEADAMIRERRLYQAALLRSSDLALAFERGGLAILGPDGRIGRMLDQSTGLADEQVNYIAQTRQGVLWLALNNGLVRAELLEPFSRFGLQSGIKGSVRAVTRHKGSIYASTYFGVFRLEPGSSGRPGTFLPVRSASRNSWSLLPTEAGLLAGTSDGVFAINGEANRTVAPSGPVYALLRSKHDSSLAYAGGTQGIAMLRLRGGVWTSAGRIEGVRETVRDLAESPDGTLWAGTDYEGLLRIQRTRGVERWAGRSGLPTGWVKPFVAGGAVRFGTAKGIYVFNQAQNTFVADAELDAALPADSKGAYRFREDNLGSLWIASNGENGILRKSNSGRYEWNPVPLRRAGKIVVHDIYNDADGSIWLATEEGIIRRDARGEQNARRAYPVVIRQVESLGDESILHYGSNAVAQRVVLPFQRNSIAFSFAAPGNDDSIRTEYQAWLEGYERGSGSWSPETEKAYTNLSEGRYVFRVRAHNLYGALADEARFPFEILAPWYRTKWAYLLYGLAFIGCAFGLGNLRSRALEAKNRRLQAIIEERTAEIQAQADALQKQNRELERLDQEKNEFLSIAAHDLKSPLFEISMGAKLLRDDSGRIPAERIEDYAKEMESSASLMHRIVSNLLDIQRIEEGAIAVAVEECDMNQIAERVINSYRRSAQAKRVAISFERSSGEARVMGDAGLLAQIVDNLLSNAIKYSYPDSGVSVRVSATAAVVRVEVEDRGPGISAQEQARLFTKFGRLSTQPTGGESSTGLGLAIVKRLINAMGGEAGCLSIVGQGSTFYIQMPALKSDGDAPR